MDDGGMIDRPRERAVLERSLLGDNPGTVLLHGAPGSGKSSLLGGLLAHAHQSARTVLLLRATEAGRDVELAGLLALLGDVPDQVLDALPGPLAVSLRAALLRDDAVDAVDPRALRAGVLGVLRELVEREASPLLVAVDDAQWVDARTLDLLEHAVRHLPVGRLGLLLVTWDAATAVRLRGFAAAGATVTEVTPAPLTLTDTDRLARSLGVEVSTRVVREVHEASGGNPMWATELLRAEHPEASAGSLEQLVENRVALLPARHRALLVAAALAGRPEPLVVVRAAGLDDSVLGEVDGPGLRQVVRVEDGLLRFAHPLLASAVLRLAGAADVHAVHGRLAEIEEDELARARHLALSDPSDPASVRVLDSAADRASTTGRRTEAARLARLALSLTAVGDPERPSRMLRSAEAHWAVGMPDEALADLAGLDDLPAQPEAARLLRARVLTEVAGDAGPAAFADLRADPDLSLTGRAEVLAALALLTPVDAGLEADLRQVADELDASDDPTHAPVRTVLATVLADLALRTDRPEVADLLGDAIAREGRLDAAGRRAMVVMGMDATPRLSMARHLIALDDFGPARRLLEEVAAEAGLVQDDLVLGAAGLERGHLEVRAGDWDRARAEATTARDRFGLVRSPSGVAMATVQLGAVAALRGEEEQAYALLAEAEERGRAEGLTFAVATARGNLGRMALAAGRLDEALDHFAVSAEAWASSPMDTPLYNHFLLDRAEALVAAGDPGAGIDALAPVERMRAPTPRLLSGASRVRALTGADAGRTDDAIAAAHDALAVLAPVALPFEEARAHLVLGRVLRRARRKGAADRALAEAAEAFAALGAPVWREWATRERSRVGLRRTTGLTETERRVAELAADGLRNTDIASTLFLATKTVEATLARVYRKLGIRGRAELARALDALP